MQEMELPEKQASQDQVKSSASGKNRSLEYFALVVVLTIPFWLFGGNALPIPVKLPVSALSLVIPLISALILTYRRDRLTGVRKLFKRVLDFPKIKNKIWYLPVLILYPLIAVLSYAGMRLAGRPLPDPQIPWLMVPVYLLVFFIAGIGEELGWMGYAYDPMQERWGALKASVFLGVFWATYHLIPDLQNQQPADWILWHRLGTIAFRVLIAWVYNNTGKSIFAVILFHAVNNLAWALFPTNGTHYDPFVNFLLTLPVVAFVIIGWESKTLARFRFARPHLP
jgi:hypothetical protein